MGVLYNAVDSIVDTFPSLGDKAVAIFDAVAKSIDQIRGSALMIFDPTGTIAGTDSDLAEIGMGTKHVSGSYRHPTSLGITDLIGGTQDIEGEVDTPEELSTMAFAQMYESGLTVIGSAAQTIIAHTGYRQEVEWDEDKQVMQNKHGYAAVVEQTRERLKAEKHREKEERRKSKKKGEKNEPEVQASESSKA